MPADTIRPLRGKVLVHNIESGAKLTRGGIIIPDDDGRERGIRERWAQVYAIGSDVEDVKVGDWVLIKHGRWSRGVTLGQGDGAVVIRQIDWPDAVLLVSDTNLAERSY